MAELSVNRNRAIIKQLRSLLLDQDDALADMQALARAACVLTDGKEDLEPQDVSALLARLSIGIREMRRRHGEMCGLLAEAERADEDERRVSVAVANG